jgi:glycosyltransferase involved in cell wall biosynthesis
MKIIMLSTDENIFKEGSEVRNRVFEYGKLVEELHIIIKSQIPNPKSQNFGNVFLYPTSSKFIFLYFFDAYKTASKIIRNWKPARPAGGLEIRNCIVTCQDPFETGLVGYLLKKKFSARGRSALGGKISLHIQIHTDFLSQYFWKESLKNKIRIFIAKRIIPKADGIRVVSERIKRSIIVNCKLKIENSAIAVLPIFIDIEKIKNAPIKTDLHKKYPGKFIVLMASRLTREKNIELAIKSAKNLIPNRPNLLFLIVGSGPEESKLKAISHNLKANVVFEPWSDDLSSYYKTSDLFLLTSDYEGYGMTVIEATAAGLPVLMTDVGVSVGSIIPVGNSEILAERLNSLVSNSLERKRILENQKRILNDMPSKIEYLNLIKQSWSRCLGIEDPRFKSESGQNI